jgi:hypothetical protein
MLDLITQLKVEIIKKIERCSLNTPVYYELNVDNKYIILGRRLSYTQPIELFNLSYTVCTGIESPAQCNATGVTHTNNSVSYDNKKQSLINNTFTNLE